MPLVDFLGKELAVGDDVIYTKIGRGGDQPIILLERAVVVKMANKQVWVTPLDAVGNETAPQLVTTRKVVNIKACLMEAGRRDKVYDAALKEAKDYLAKGESIFDIVDYVKIVHELDGVACERLETHLKERGLY